MAAKKDTSAESSSVLFGVWSVAHSVTELLDKALNGSGLNADEFGFYSALYDGQPITPNEISEHLGMPATTVSSYLSRLSARGHISRSKNPSDGRSALIELTPEGLEVLHEAWKCFAPAQAAVESALALPVEQVIGTLKQLTEAVQTAAAKQEPYET
ncbi:MAG: MarR family winged helix-turn-helix transcriptional regulator [Gaiellaceae bacterium]